MLTSVIFLALVSLQSTLAACPLNWDLVYNGTQCVQLFQTKLTFENATSACVDLGGNLPSIHSNDEQNALLLLSGTMPWIGLSYGPGPPPTNTTSCTGMSSEQCSEFLYTSWVDNESWSDGSANDYYEGWGTTNGEYEPIGMEDAGCVALDSSGWRTLECSQQRDYICMMGNNATSGGNNSSVNPDDVCDPNPCSNFGKCNVDESTNTGFKCTCDGGWEGVDCSENVDPCMPSPCVNAIGCTAQGSDYLCLCQEGYGGVNCTEPIQPCAELPCKNEGLCTPDGANYTCACVGAWEGTNCTEPIEPCAELPCKNEGVCTPDGANYTCACIGAWQGTNCTEPIEPCAVLPCQNGGVCTPDGTNYTCACIGAWQGTNCTEPIQPCAELPCQNEGVCTPDGANYTCACVGAWQGANCTEPIEPCAELPCKNEGVCTPDGTNYTCACIGAWQGTNCTEPIQPCAEAPCKNEGVCTPDGANYTCACVGAWQGTNCTEPIEPCSEAPCKNNGTCTSEGLDYTCSCVGVWEGMNCTEAIQPCAQFPCQNNGTCTSEGTNYTCACVGIWEGVNCDQEIKPCDPNPCLHGGGCKVESDNATLAVCICIDDWTGPTCDIKVAESPSPTPSVSPSVTPSVSPSVTPSVSPSVTPSASPSVTLTPSVTLSASPSVTPSVSVSPSVSITPSPSLTPTPSITPTATVTPSRFSSPSRTPSVTPTVSTTPSVTPSIAVTPSPTRSPSAAPCTPNPCEHEGTCFVNPTSTNGFTCDCTSQWTGETCGEAISPIVDNCDSEPCQNGGVCSTDDTATGYSCACSAPYTGDVCAFTYTSTIDADFNTFDKDKFEVDLANSLGVPTAQVNVTKVSQGSVIVDLSLSTAASKTMTSKVQTGSKDVTSLGVVSVSQDGSITANPDFESTSSSGLSTGVIIGIAVAAVIALLMSVVIVAYFLRRRHSLKTADPEPAQARPQFPTSTAHTPVSVDISPVASHRSREAAANGNADIGYYDSVISRPLPEFPSDIYEQTHAPEAIAVREQIRTRAGPIPDEAIVKLGVLGTGAFGIVYRGVLREDDEDSPVAIKELKATEQSQIDQFIQEAEVMKKLCHPNVMACIGLVTGPPVAIVLELMTMGDLWTYLRTQDKRQSLVTIAERFYISFQISCGMNYLAHHGVVHRDLAARNCMMSAPMKGSFGYPLVKVADFGLSREVDGDSNYYRMESTGKVPVPWMSPEALKERKFSQASDVWSYGVTVWEIFSNANTVPYSGQNFYGILNFLTNGGRLTKPDGCPQEAYDLMKDCWEARPSDRPDFQLLTDTIAQLFVPHCPAPVRVAKEGIDVFIREATVREAQAQDEEALYVDMDNYDNEVPNAQKDGYDNVLENDVHAIKLGPNSMNNNGYSYVDTEKGNGPHGDKDDV